MAMMWSIGRLKEVRDVELLANNIRSPAGQLVLSQNKNIGQKGISYSTKP
jgi:hypothetical protein